MRAIQNDATIHPQTALQECIVHEGHVRVDCLLTPQEVSRFRAADFLSQRRPQLWDVGGTHPVIQFVSDPWLECSVLSELVFHSAICGMAETLSVRPLRLFSSELLSKPPRGSAPTSVHDDTSAIPVTPADPTISAWGALVDVPVNRGCLTFVPGSHVRPKDGIDYEWLSRTTVPLRAGDCTFHHVRTIHMAGVSLSDAERLSATITFVDANCRYLPKSAGTPVKGLVPGDELPDADYPRVSA